MTHSTRIALVTVLYNCEKHLPLFFECMGKQSDSDFLVIIVDNASNDASLQQSHTLAKAFNVPCEFIENKDNLGIAVGNNQGIERARELGLEHIVLINNDIGCETDLIAQIRKRAIGQGRLAWTCLSFLRDTSTRWYGGGRLSYWRARGMHYDQKSSEKIKTAQQVSYAPTCLMYVHASVFDKVGLMDGRYFVYYDDTDFCRRLADHQVPLIYDPEVTFNHYVGGSSGGEFSEFSMRINTRNKFYYIRKHYSGLVKWTVMSVALASKLAQLVSKKRRRPTLLGLRDAWHFPS